MDTAYRIAALAVLAAVLCVLLREREKALAAALSLLACVIVLLLSIKFLQPIWDVLEQLEQLSGLQDSVTAPLLKTVGIGILTQIAMGVCTDAGETALSKIVEISGSILSVYTSLPLLMMVLELLKKLLGGSA